MQQGLVMGSYPSKLDIATFVEMAIERTSGLQLIRNFKKTMQIH